MAGYRSGLSYETLQKAVGNNALETLSRGGFRKNGKRLQAVLTYKDAEGRRRFLAHSIDETKAQGRGRTNKAEKDAILAEWRAQVVKDLNEVAGVLDDPTIPVEKAVERFIQTKEIRSSDGANVGARNSTLTFYRSCAKRIERYPRLATKRLMDATEADVQAWVNAMATGEGLPKPLSKKSIKDSLNLLSQTCRKYKLDVNPCEGVTIPKNAKAGRLGGAWRLPNHLTPGSVARLNTLLDAREKKARGIDYVVVSARIALHTGMRCEEVCGLRWRDVDLLNRRLHVVNVIERSSVPVVGEDGKRRTRYVEEDAMPKTAGSIRTIPIDAMLADELKRHRARVAAMVAEEHTHWGKKRLEEFVRDSYVITKNERNEFDELELRHYSPHRLGANFKKWAIRSNIRGTEEVAGMHTLRHTFATLSLQNGKPVSEVSRILGHSKISTTLNLYVGSSEDAQREVVDAMAEVFGARTPDDVVILKSGTEG